MEECIFCKITKGEIPATKIYEDHNFFCFLDIAPVNKGHALVVPKTHSTNIMEMNDGLRCEMMNVVKKVAKAVVEGVGADGFNIGVNVGEAAGQVVMHTHLHVIPRFLEDGLKSWSQGNYSEGEADKVAEKITKHL